MVIFYLEVIKNNMDELKENDINFIELFLFLDDEKEFVKRIVEEFKIFNVIFDEVKKVVEVVS